MAHLYKSILQNYAQKRNIPFPTYTCVTQGPPHARLFKAHVTIDGKTYEGPEFFTTLKDAEHAAAKVAYLALSPDGEQEDACLYKSLLQELAQKKGLLLPVYSTNRTGPPHMPCFASTVEIAGESYAGQEARTKKQSEMNAAKVAYAALNQGGSPKTKSVATYSNNRISSSGSTSLPPVMTFKIEPTVIPPVINTQTTVNNEEDSYSVANEADKGKGYFDLKNFQDVIQRHTMTVPPAVIPQSQSTVKPLVADFAKLRINQENVTIQAGEGSGSNGKINQSSFNEKTSNPVAGPSGTRPHSTKIVIRPHVPDMTYDGPIHFSDNDWVAMKVDVYEEI